MNIEEHLRALIQDRNNIISALEEQGSTDVETHGFDNFADDILSLQTLTKVTIPIFNDNLLYDGEKQTATFNGYDVNTMTISGQIDGVEVKTYTATFTLKNGYIWQDNTTGDKYVQWWIQKSTPTYTTPSAKSLIYNGKEQELITASTVSGGTIYYDLNNDSWSTSLPTSKDVSSNTVRYKIIGDKNHLDVNPTTIGISTISPANISGSTISAMQDQFYLGIQITPQPTLTQNSETLEMNKDYTCSYSNNIEIGTATITIAGKGNYTGTTSKTFKIVENIPSFSYTGSYNFTNEGNGTWTIELTSSGTLTFNHFCTGDGMVDIYAVGGGGGAATVTGGWILAVGGGGGGCVSNIYNYQMQKNAQYAISVGSGGSGRYVSSVDVTYAANSGGSSTVYLNSTRVIGASGGGYGAALSGWSSGEGAAEGGSGGSGGGAGYGGANSMDRSAYGQGWFNNGTGGSNGANGYAPSFWMNGGHLTAGSGSGVKTGPFGTDSSVYAHGGGCYSGDGTPTSDNTGAGGCYASSNGKSGKIIIRTHR